MRERRGSRAGDPLQISIRSYFGAAADLDWQLWTRPAKAEQVDSKMPVLAVLPGCLGWRDWEGGGRPLAAEWWMAPWGLTNGWEI